MYVDCDFIITLNGYNAMLANVHINQFWALPVTHAQ